MDRLSDWPAIFGREVSEQGFEQDGARGLKPHVILLFRELSPGDRAVTLLGHRHSTFKRGPQDVFLKSTF